MDKIDYKKEYKKFYSVSAKKAEKIEVPEFNFLKIDGEGDPNKSELFVKAVELFIRTFIYSEIHG